MTFWTVKPDVQPGWTATRNALPKFTPVPAKAAPAAKKARQ